MQNKKITVSIGIPAHNEAENISKLISQVLSQNQENFVLNEIIVVSDGSTDKTVEVIRQLRNPLIKLIDKSEREGKSTALNTIFRLSKEQVLILLDADVSFKSNVFFLDTFISLFQSEKAGIAAVKNVPLEGTNLIEKSINFGIWLQEEIKHHWKEADNYLCFRGQCLAINNELVKKIVLPRQLTNDDAYLYFEAKRLGYTTKYFDTCQVFYRSPDNIKDYANQVSRFEKSRGELQEYFSKGDLSYRIPFNLTLQTIIKGFLINPVYFITYLILFCVTRIKLVNQQNVTGRSMASSTKKL